MRPLKAILLGAAAACIPALALAQQNQSTAKLDSDASRVTFDAHLTTTLAYTDNLFANQNNKQSDEIRTLQPTASLTLNDETRRLTMTAQGDITRHNRTPSEDSDDWKVGLDGRAQLGRPFTLVGGGEFAWQHEARTSPDADAGLTPTDYRRGYGFAGLVIDGEAFRARLAGTLNRLDYADVAGVAGAINGDDRDRLEDELGLRLGHPVGRGLKAFAQGAYNLRRYDEPIDDAGYRRGSEGYSAALGVRRTGRGGLTGEIFAGVLQQDYDDPRLKDVSTFDLGVVIDWTGTKGAAGSLRLERSIEETTLPGASAYLVTSASLGLRTTVHPRLAAGAGFSGARYDYQGVLRSETVTGANLWGRYWFARRAFIGLDYNFAQRTSDAAGYDYDENRLALTLGGQMQPEYVSGLAPLTDLLAREAPAGLYVAVFATHGSLTTGLDGSRGSGSNTADFGNLGSSFAAIVGYGVLAGPLYAGLELERQGVGPKWTHLGDRAFSVDRRDSYGLSGRLGYVTAPGAMIFGRVGAAETSFRTSYVHSEDVALDDKRRNGLLLGLGMEAGDERFFVRVDYAVTDYRDYDVPAGGENSDNFSDAETQFRVGAGVRLSARAPKAEPSTGFSGLYAGLSLGHGALASFNVGPRSGGAIAVDRASDGPLIGGMIGGGVAFEGFYVGGELHADWSDIEWNIERDPTGRTFSISRSNSVGLGARLGRQIGPAGLLYVRAGPIRTRFGVDYATSGAAVITALTRKGTSVGVGLETALSAHRRIRMEYDVASWKAFEVPYGALVDTFDNKDSNMRITFIIAH